MMQRSGHGKTGYALMDRETYLELFGIGPEEIYTPEQLRRIDMIVARDGLHKRSCCKLGLQRRQNETVDE